MKKLLYALIALTSISMTSYAQNGKSLSGKQDCVPYTIPVLETAVACDPGYRGLKYLTKSQSCPDGKISTSSTYNTSNCVRVVPTNSNGVRCDLTPDACAAGPVSTGCPPGKHWTMQGLPYAHCVTDDMQCPWGTSLKHSAIGEPSCIKNTCPSNQGLQGDGISCACPSSLPNWDGGQCQPPVCIAPATQTVSTQACTTYYGSAAYSGNVNTLQSYSCPSRYGAYVTNPVTYDASNCSKLTACTAPATTSSTQACTTYFGDPAYVGTVTTKQSYACSSAYGSVIAKTPEVDTSACSKRAICSAPATTSSTLACTSYYGSSGYSGNVTATQSYSCPSTYGGYNANPVNYDTSQCRALTTCVAPAPTVSTQACDVYYGKPGKYTGNIVSTTTYTCPSQYGVATANPPKIDDSKCIAYTPPASGYSGTFHDYTICNYGGCQTDPASAIKQQIKLKVGSNAANSADLNTLLTAMKKACVAGIFNYKKSVGLYSAVCESDAIPPDVSDPDNSQPSYWNLIWDVTLTNVPKS